MVERSARPRAEKNTDGEFHRIVASKQSYKGEMNPADKIKAKHGGAFEIESEDAFRVVFREPMAQHIARTKAGVEARAKALGDISDGPSVEGQYMSKADRRGTVTLGEYAERLPDQDLQRPDEDEEATT